MSDEDQVPASDNENSLEDDETTPEEAEAKEIERQKFAEIRAKMLRVKMPLKEVLHKEGGHNGPVITIRDDSADFDPPPLREKPATAPRQIAQDTIEEEPVDPLDDPLDDPDDQSGTIPEERVPATNGQLSTRKQIEAALMAGVSRNELIEQGFNKRSVQTVASELKTKMQVRDPLGRAGKGGRQGIQVFAKGSPPEALIDSVQIPDLAGDQGEGFEKGLKFGMTVLVLGVRMAQELSSIGTAQAKPIIDMAKTMREGESAMAKAAAAGAAEESGKAAAAELMNGISPTLNAIIEEQAIAKAAREDKDKDEDITVVTAANPKGKVDPMLKMMRKPMMTMIETVMNQMMQNMPGMPKMPPAAPGETAQIEGFTRKSE